MPFMVYNINIFIALVQLPFAQMPFFLFGKNNVERSANVYNAVSLAKDALEKVNFTSSELKCLLLEKYTFQDPEMRKEFTPVMVWQTVVVMYQTVQKAEQAVQTTKGLSDAGKQQWSNMTQVVQTFMEKIRPVLTSKCRNLQDDRNVVNRAEDLQARVNRAYEKIAAEFQPIAADQRPEIKQPNIQQPDISNTQL
jgi:hypothetical protein